LLPATRFTTVVYNMRWLNFILSHSIFISLCGAALCYQTFYLLHVNPVVEVYGLVFFATLGSYNFYWLIAKYFSRNDPSHSRFYVKNFSNIIILGIAGFSTLYCLYYLPEVLPSIIIASGLTILYSVPLWPVKQLAFTRKTGFLKTFLLAFTWAYVTVMIPAQLATDAGSRSVILLFIARFLFMLMLCIIFDTRDITVDRIKSLRSLATDVSHRTLQVIVAIVFIIYVSSGFLLRYHFRDTPQLIAFFVTASVTLVVYRLSQKKQGYFFYYFVVDGLMLFSSLATFVASI